MGGESVAEMQKDMEKLPREENLETYTAEADRIKAELKLKTGLTDVEGYVADVKFYTNPVWQGEKEGFSVTAHYSLFSLKGIFQVMKRAEAGFEEILMPPADHNYEWQEHREVMKCILSLEEQTKHLYEERRKAKKERELKVYNK